MSPVPSVVMILTVMVGSAAQAEYMLPRQEMSPAEAAVRKVVDQHIAGLASRDAKLIESAWDTKIGRVTFIERGRQGPEHIGTAPISDAIALWVQPDAPASGEILNVDLVNDNMALVKAKIQWNGQVYEEYLVLLAVSDNWKLVSKTYSSANHRDSGGYGVSRVQR